MNASYQLEARHEALRALLEEARARLSPQDVGLPRNNGLRRVPGLRRSEVAELVGVSTRWYEMFEEGPSDRRFSAEFVHRVADALRLDEGQRVTLFRLTMPEVRLAVEQVERSALDGALRSFTQVRELARRLTCASSFEEAVEAAAKTLERVLSPSCFAAATLLPEEPRRVIAVGPKADVVITDFADGCIAVNYPNRNGAATFNESRPAREETGDGSFVFRQQTTDGQSFLIEVSAALPPMQGALVEPSCGGEGGLCAASISAHDYWGWNSKVESRSSLTTGLFTSSLYRGNLSALWAEPHAMSPVEIETVQTASALVELAAAPGRATF